MDMDRPGKNEWYHMGTACEVRRVLSQQPSRHEPRHMRLTFNGDPDEDRDGPVVDVDEQKRYDMAAFGGGRYTPPPAPDPEDDDQYGGEIEGDTSHWDGGGDGR